MRKENKHLFYIAIRYISLFIITLVLSFSSIFYKIFLILTIYPVNFILGFFYNSSIAKDTIVMYNTANTLSIVLIPACIAVSAYMLLLILNLTTEIHWKKRIYSLIFSFFSLLFVNIARICILSLLFINNYSSFDIVHKLFWYFLSIIFVVCIWFISVYAFKIKKIPVYDDFISMISLIRKDYKS